jgi:hypothetical protein
MTIDQKSYRWYNDDGSEQASTPAANPETAITLALDTPKHLRIQLNPATDDPANSYYRLEYKKSTDSSYKVVKAEGTGGEAVTLAASTNISGGEGTAYRATNGLSIPSGKASGDFQASYARDNANGTDAFDFSAASKYSEMLWVVKAVSGVAQASDTYQFRVTRQTITSSGITFNAQGGDAIGDVSLSYNINTTAGTNSFAIVGIAYQNGAITTCKIDGLDMTQSGTPENNAVIVALYYLALGSISAGNKTIAITSSSTYIASAGIIIDGAAQTSSINATQTGQGTGTTPSISITTTAANCAIFDICNMNDGSACTIGSQTNRSQVYLANPATGSTDGVAASKIILKTSAGGQTLDWTQASSSEWAAKAIAINPA